MFKMTPEGRISESTEMTLSGKLFQSSAAATGKARLPTVDSLIGGTSRVPSLANSHIGRFDNFWIIV